MRRKMAMIMIFLLTVVLTGSIFGCGKTRDSTVSKGEIVDVKTNDKNEITFPLKTKKTYSVFSGMNNGYDLKDNPTMQKLLGDSNIEFNFQSVLGADITEKRNLVIASNDYPEVFYRSGLPQTDLDKYGKQGVLIPLEDMIKKYAPNLSKSLDERDAWDRITSADGHIYGLPEIAIDTPAPLLWVNKKWIDNLGLKEPKTLEEYYDVLEEFKEKDANGNGDPNDEIPYSAASGGELYFFLNNFCCYDAGTRSAVIDKKWTYMPTSDIFKDFLKYFTKMYKNGLLDKNSFTQNTEQQIAVGQSGDKMGSFFNEGGFVVVGRDNDEDYVASPCLGNNKLPIQQAIYPGTVAITDKCKDPETIIAWADQFYTQEGGIHFWLGYEGTTWEKTDSGKWKWKTDRPAGKDIALLRSSETIQGGGNIPTIQPQFWIDNMDQAADPDEYYLDQERARIAKLCDYPLPYMRYSDDDNMALATLKTDIDPYVDQYMAQVITGKKDLEDSWGDYTKTLNDMGLDQLKKIYQNSYNDAIKK